MAAAAQRREAVRDAYRKFIGRNHYSQKLRNYALTKYKDGKYYSDCSSSVSYAYKAAGEGFGILNTVGMWTSKKLVDVPVKISKGQITNPEVLRVGDMLLFAGNDSGRKKYGYVGHVEMVGEISSGKIMLYGHGSGLAKKHEMKAYCRTRYNTKASTPLGRRLLIRVRRRITDDGEQLPVTPAAEDTGAALAVLEKGSIGPAVKAMQTLLLKRDPGCLPAYGADGDFGEETRAAVLAFQLAVGIERTGVYDDETAHSLLLAVGSEISVTGGTVNVRSGPGKKFPVLGVVRKGDVLSYQGMWEYSDAESLWLLVVYHVTSTDMPRNAWISEKYAEVRA